MSYQNESTYVPKFVSKQVRAYCKKKQTTNATTELLQKHGIVPSNGTRRSSEMPNPNSNPNPAPLGSLVSLGKLRVQYSGSIRESTTDVHPSLLGSNESMTESLTSDFGNLDDPPETEESIGACAIIEMVGYSALVEQLSKLRNIPSQLIARSLESYLSKVIDIIQDCHGDIVTMIGDTIHVYWRAYTEPKVSSVGHQESWAKNTQNSSADNEDYFQGDSKEFLFNDSNRSNAIMSAIICCTLCVNFLGESEVWALEDISPEFSGLKLVARCVIGSGSIIDVHVGVRGIHMEHLLFGSAMTTAVDCLKDKIFEGEVAIDCNSASLVQYQLKRRGIVKLRHGEHSQILSPPAVGMAELQNSVRYFSDSIMYADSTTEHIPVSTVLESFLTDGAAFHLRALRRQRKGLSLFGGSWTQTSIVIVRIKPLSNEMPLTDQPENVSHTVSSVLKYCQITRVPMEIVLQHCRHHGMILHRVVAHPDFSISLVCAVGGVWSNLENDPEVVAVKTALSIRESIFKSSANGKVCTSYFVSSGRAYEGLLINRHRCDFRLVGKFTTIGLKMIGYMAMDDSILVDEATSASCKSTFLEGFLYPVSAERIPQIFANEFKISTFMAIAPFNTAAYTSKSCKGAQETASDKPTNTDSSIAFRHKLERIQQICTDVITSEDAKTILIEGSQGYGKTFLINRTKEILENSSFLTCFSECREYEAFRHPLYPYTIIIPQLFDLIDTVLPNHIFSSFKSRNMLAKNVLKSANNLAKQDISTMQTAQALNALKISRLFPSLAESLSKHSTDQTDISTLDSQNKLGVSMNKSHTTTANLPVSAKKSKFSTYFQRKTAAQVVPLEENKTLDTPLNQSEMIKYGEIRKSSRISVLSEKDSYISRNVSEAYRNALIRAGEDPDVTLPLLNALILPDIPDTKATKDLKPDNRTFLLSRLIVRLIKKITAVRHLAITIDDVHWMDSASWQITMHIIRQCEKTVIVLAASESPDYRAALISQVKNMPQTEVIELRGWSKNSIERYMHTSYSSRAKEISEEIIDVIKLHCDGNPSFIKNMSRYIVESNHVTCQDGKLVLNLPPQELITRLPSSFSKLIIWQYDNIRSKEFQRFLRCASVVGRHFSLEEIAVLWNDSSVLGHIGSVQADDHQRQTSIQRLAALIVVYDIFGMIDKIDIKSRQNDPHYPFQTAYMFHHGMAYKTIYTEKLNEQERKNRHLKLIRFYERNLSDENEPIFIPLICLHHQNAGLSDRISVLKRIQYMMMLGTYICASAEAYMETRAIFIEMDKIIADMNIADELGPEILGVLHLRLGVAFNHGKLENINRTQCLRHILIAISLLNYSWPKTNVEWWAMVLKQSFKWMWKMLFNIKPTIHLINHEQWELLFHEKHVKNKYLDRLEHLEPAIALMSNYLFETDARLRDQIACNSLHLNISYGLGHHVAEARIRLLITYALKIWFSGKLKLAQFLADRSISLQNQLSENTNDTVTITYSTLYLTACGNWTDARKWAIRGMELCSRVGDLNGWLICSHQRCFMLIFDGHFKEALELEKQRGHECRISDATIKALWSDSVIAQISVLQGDTMAAHQFCENMSYNYKSAPPSLRIQFQGIFAQLELAKKNFDSCLACVEQIIELIPKLHYSNNQIFYSVLLSVLAMYSMTEQSNTTTIRSRRTYHQFSKTGRSKAVQKSLARVFTMPSDQLLIENQNISTRPVTRTFTQDNYGAQIKGVYRRMSLDVAEVPRSLNNRSSCEPMPLKSVLGSVPATFSKTLSTCSVSEESTASFNVDRSRIRLLGMKMISILQPFKEHALCEPMLLLTRGLIRVLDGSVISSPMDTPSALRDWAHRFEPNKTGDMRFMVGVMAIKSWRISGEVQEYEPERQLATQIFVHLGIENCLKIL
ncbi:hypothetical protein BDV3_004236 [Batrachochytrium dendrobatidis]